MFLKYTYWEKKVPSTGRASGQLIHSISNRDQQKKNEILHFIKQQTFIQQVIYLKSITPTPTATVINQVDDETIQIEQKKSILLETNWNSDEPSTFLRTKSEEDFWKSNRSRKNTKFPRLHTRTVFVIVKTSIEKKKTSQTTQRKREKNGTTITPVKSNIHSKIGRGKSILCTRSPFDTGRTNWKYKQNGRM